MSKLKFKKLNPLATGLKLGSRGAAGYDLQSMIDIEVAPGQQVRIPTGIAVAVPAGYVGMVCPRSGMVNKFRVGVGNSPGMIDSDYRGEVIVLLQNLSDKPYSVGAGSRVAQFVITVAFTPDTEEVAELDDTERGTGGLGSTGIAAL